MVQHRVSTHQREVLRERARVMRHVSERSEAVLRQALRRCQLGVCFRRQVVLQGFIADFYAAEPRLIVEVDGRWHAERATADSRRDRMLAGAGYRVMRVTMNEVLHSLPEVLVRITAAMQGGS